MSHHSHKMSYKNLLNPGELAERLARDNNFREILNENDLRLDLKYASEDNFLNENLYGEFTRCFLHEIAARKLNLARENLKQVAPHLSVILYDGLRPRRVQRRMWDALAGTPRQDYVSDPEKGSMHNFGMAVDLSLLDSNGRELEMGTPFDSFEEESRPDREEVFISNGRLTQAAHENRLLLRKVMTEAGFLQLPHEWWHYNALEPGEVRARYEIIE